jgi:hypothetical protein
MSKLRYIQQMRKIIGKCKIYFEPVRMFRQIVCQLQGISNKELQVLSAPKCTIYMYTYHLFYI